MFCPNEKRSMQWFLSCWEHFTAVQDISCTHAKDCLMQKSQTYTQVHTAQNERSNKDRM